MKVKLITESNKKFQRMQTAFGWGRPADNVKTFAIISYENPLGWKNSEEEEFIKKYQAWLNNPKKYNADAKTLSKDALKNKMLDSIKRKGDETLKYGHFSYVNIEGSYFGQREKSRIIFNLPYIDAQGLARDYGQESFFFAKVVDNNPVIAYYETKDACKTYKLVDISNTISDRTDADDFFSKYGLVNSFIESLISFARNVVLRAGTV